MDIHSIKDTKELSAFLLENASTDPLSEEQESNLIQQIRNGDDDALVELLKAHIRFVVSIAEIYKNNGLELQDLIAAGTGGLVQAAYKFDESKGTRFVHYAIWWIRASIIEAIISPK